MDLIDKYKSDLILAAVNARANSYCIISRVCVGAAILTKSGRIFTGVNVENPVLPCGWCAEVSAIGAAVTNGCRDLVACAISTNTSEFIAPCGRCRQVLAEFSQHDDMPVFMVNDQGNVDQASLSYLLPKQFGKHKLPDLSKQS